MKCPLFLLSFVAIAFLGACKSMQFTSQPTTDTTISPLQTFAVTPPNGAYNLIGLEPGNVPEVTMAALAAQMTKRGYTQVALEASPDFIVKSQWMISMQNNPEYLMNAGNIETQQQIPEIIQVASLDVYVVAGDGGRELWHNSSPWPFNARRGTTSDMQTAAVWALEGFPYQLGYFQEN